MYSDVPDGTPAYTYQFGVDQCGNYSGEGDCFNREHSFPQSWFNGEPPADTDLFHLYPTDAWANQKRANNAYGEVGSTTWVGSNGSKLGQCVYPGCSGLVFEPIDAYKGDLARSYFYMLVRYLPDLDSWSSPMMSNGAFLPWAENMLMEWHASDPVSSKEVDRNNDVYAIQGNRNPFIDNPQWASSIWGATASVDEMPAPIAQVRYAKGQLQVNGLAQGHSAALSLSDAMGRSIGTWRISWESTRVAVELPAGVYLARLSDGERSSMLRFVP
jgi:endonuclease I